MRHQRNRVVTVLLMGWAFHAVWRGTDCNNAVWTGDRIRRPWAW